MSEDARERFNPQSRLRVLRGRGGAGQYLDVKWRLLWIKDEVDAGTFGHAALTIDSELIQVNERFAIFRATVTVADENGRIVLRGVGHGSETATDFGDFIEKAETKARGRALEAIGFGTAGAEAEPDDRPVDAPVEGNPRREESRGGGPPPVQPNATRASEAESTVRVDLGGLHGDIKRAYERAFGVDDIDAHAAAKRLAKLWYNLDSLKELTPRGLGIFRAKVRGLSNDELIAEDSAALDMQRQDVIDVAQ
jgi:hypothetical protein